MPAPRGTTKASCCAGLLLALAACSTPARSVTDIDRGRFDLKLAAMYLDGTGVPRDDSKAAYLLSDASAAGDIDAKGMLGRLYADGRGVGRDDEFAVALFRTAVDGGSVAALTDLGRMIETGRGTPAVPRTALDYYERGMDAGDPIARNNYQRLQKSLELTAPKAKPVEAVPPIVKQDRSPPA
ncbi:MAG TPA: tetratricopeptide repeat protein [Aliidongia sp.]|nr:tetratricopeptide repeat protein [Aliidongia sp.]